MNGNYFSEGRIKLVNAFLGITIFITFMGLSGCVDLKVRAGQSINIDGLDSLEIGVSTSDDVRLLIGSPFGIGRSQLAMQEESVEMWSYYYELGTLSDDRRTFLFVYLDDGIYDGHMWFSSLPETLE
jgi:hypothetical protein